MSSLEALIQAAQYLEENGQDEETPRKRTHRYRMKKPSTYSRTTHNLLEKNRRAQLRDCLEVLRQHVPLPDKLTTLALLQSAKKYIETLQQKEREENEIKIKLQNAQALLLSRLAELGAGSYVNSTNLSPKSSPSRTPTTSSVGTNTSPPPSSHLRAKAQRSPSPRSPLRPPDREEEEEEEDESIVIDVLSQESEDDISSTTSGSDGGCTTTSHKYEISV